MLIKAYVSYFFFYLNHINDTEQQVGILGRCYFKFTLPSLKAYIFTIHDIAKSLTIDVLSLGNDMYRHTAPP